ncbi:hypothetical protein C8J57DRAFT_265236 [Mycena rebaudengoi]|nr:hypothetical protein C8J57DRAFT_265236 [Mycena rebaudengoi]
MDKKASTCKRCRAMKIRCDGKDPCDPCSRARTEVTCNYTRTPTIVSGSELQKGTACSACRNAVEIGHVSHALPPERKMTANSPITAS